MANRRNRFRQSYNGGCTIYFADGNPPATDVQTGTYDLDLMRDVEKDLAGQHFEKTGNHLRALPERAIAHDVVLLVRPTATKTDVTRSLKALIRSIEKEGLVLGGNGDTWRDVGDKIIK